MVAKRIRGSRSLVVRLERTSLGSMGLLAELDRLVESDYRVEINALEADKKLAEIALVTGLSVRDLNIKNGKPVFRPPTSKLEVLASWKKLMAVLKKHEVFLEYLKSLREAFVQFSAIQSLEFRHLKTLISLLSHTAENSQRDNSTECRFVTLLEVLLSYGNGWQPSEQITRFWVRLMQRIPADVPKVNFRRKAYRVLVSLSWVPSSKGLLGACSFEDNRQILDSEKAPADVRGHLKRIRNTPLPRYDCVNQLLDRLKDETDVCVAIRSELEGTGKTTLAALVASHPSILRVFRVLWLPMDQRDVTYTAYAKLLSNLCDQLGVAPSWPEYVTRFEEPALRQLREKEYMEEARAQMSEILLNVDENILLILDDVQNASQIKNFRFNDRQSIIVTTPDPNLAGVDWTVELDPMSEEEAIELFLAEADLPPAHILGCTDEMKAIVRKCNCHPLTVRTTARWYHLKQVTAGLPKAMEELVIDVNRISMLTSVAASKYVGNYQILFGILSQMLSPARNDGQGSSSLFILCLAAMVVVFPDRVPLDSVLLLWNQLMQNKPQAVAELGLEGEPLPIEIQKHAWLIAEGLTHLGIVSVIDYQNTAWVEAHHNLYSRLAVHLAEEMNFGVSEAFEDIAEEWNRAFVTSYFVHRIQSGDPTDDDSMAYAIDKLPDHMFRAKLFTVGETILVDENFFHARIDALGWDEAIEIHVKDCVRLQRAIEADDETGSAVIIASPVFARLSALVEATAMGDQSPNNSTIIDVSSALFQVAFALAETGFFEEALMQFDRAQRLLPHSQPLCASILYGASWTLLASGEIEQASKKIKACRKAMNDCPGIHVLFTETLQLMADIWVADCEYKPALECLDELIEVLMGSLPRSRIELGTVLYKKGRLLFSMGDLELARATLHDSLNWKVEIGEFSKNRAAAYSTLGDLLMETRQLTVAKEMFENAIVTFDALETSSDSLDRLLVTGKLRFLQGNTQGGLKFLKDAHKSIQKLPILLMDQSAYYLRSIARVYQDSGETAEAIGILYDSLSLTDSRPLSIERSAALFDLGNCSLDQEKTSEGLTYLEESLKIRVLKLGECVQVLDTLKLIGSVYMSLDDYDQSLKIFRKVHEVCERIAGSEIERIAGALYSIGEVYDCLGLFDLAMDNFTECKLVLERGREKDHPDIAKALHRLGDLVASQNNLDKAEDYFSEALRIRRMNFDDVLLAESQYSMGVILRKLGRLEESEGFLVDALETRNKLECNRETGQTLLEIGNLYRLQGEPANAVSLYEKGKEVLGNESDLLGSVYLASGHAMVSLERDEEALLCYLKAREIRLGAYGKDSAKYGNACRSLGYINYLLRNVDEAIVCLNEFVRIYEACAEDEREDSSENFDYALGIVLLGDLNIARGKPDQARKLWIVAKEIYEEDEGLTTQLPALVDMVQRRLKGKELTPSSPGKGLLSRFHGAVRLSEESTLKSTLELDPKEVGILRNIAFIDD